jgi:hypothetical protein
MQALLLDAAAISAQIKAYGHKDLRVPPPAS